VASRPEDGIAHPSDFHHLFYFSADNDTPIYEKGLLLVSFVANVFVESEILLECFYVSDYS
jgi:hypothetical protein